MTSRGVSRESGSEQVFAGEISGLISAGAFVAFARPQELGSDVVAPPFEGMLPVRLLSAPAPAGARSQAGGRRGRERTGATLRLGDPIEVRVARVDAIRGRVDLIPAG